MLPSRRAVMFLSVALGISIAMCDTVVASTSRADDVRGVVLNQTPQPIRSPGNGCAWSLSAEPWRSPGEGLPPGCLRKSLNAPSDS